MERIRLGRSNLQVSRIAFGTRELGGDWGTTDAVDRGINFFDTAQGYGFGASEHLLAQALQGRPRDQVVTATKGGLRPDPARRVQRDARPEWMRRGVDESLQALVTDYIDLYQVHWPDPKTPFAETAGALAGLVAAAKLRHVGVSNFDADQMEEFRRTLPVETLQPPTTSSGGTSRPRSFPTRSPRHIEEAIRAADLALDAQAMRRIDEIVRDEVPVGGPSPSPYEEVSAMDGTSTTSVAPRAAVPAKRRHDGR